MSNGRPPDEAQCTLVLPESILQACENVPALPKTEACHDAVSEANLRPWFGSDENTGWSHKSRVGSASSSSSKLPIAACRQQILALMWQRQVVLVQGETGSGKTTQLPQYVLDAEAAAGRWARIVVTQPRRLAAATVAARVAEERGEHAGSGAVGFKVRGASVVDSRRCQLLFCTTGVLLQRMKTLGRGNFFTRETATHLVIDEVHERTAEVDLLLAALREELPRRPSFRVVLMSATMDAKTLAMFFAESACPAVVETERRVDYAVGVAYSRKEFEEYYAPWLGKQWEHRWESAGRDLLPPICSVPGRTFSVHEQFLEDALRLLCYGKPVANDETSRAPEPMGEKHYSLLKALVLHIARAGPMDCRSEAGGAILIFLPGGGEIAETIGWLASAKELHCLPLHASLSAEEQRLCFQPAPPGLTKVVCATNVAETSITLPDITVVVDTCRERRVDLEPLSGTTLLQEQWCAQSSLLQRKGRAGRLRPGVCFRLLHQEQCAQLAPQVGPEITRLPLESLCLLVRASGLGRPDDFLMQTPDPPTTVAIQSAESLLLELGALTDDGKLSPLGKLLAELPVHPRVGRLLVFGCLLGCARPTLSIAAAMSLQSLFLPLGPNSRRGSGEVQAARREVSRQCRWSNAHDRACAGDTDHCIWAEVLERWWLATHEGQRRLCEELGLSSARVREALTERRHLVECLMSIGLLPQTYESYWPEPHATCDRLSTSRSVLRAVVSGGLYPNVVHVDARGMDLKLLEGHDEVTVHPGSICSGQVPYDWSLLVYHRKNFTKRLFVYDLTAALPAALCAFGGSVRLLESGLVIGGCFWISCRQLPEPYCEAGNALRALQGLQRAVQHLVLRAHSRRPLHLGSCQKLALLLAVLAPDEYSLDDHMEERRIYPHDGHAYTQAEMIDRFRGVYSEEETVEYWHRSCKLPGVVAPALDKLESAVADLPIGEWLGSIAQNGALMQYKDALVHRYATVVQIVDAYISTGLNGAVRLKPQFFDDICVTKVGHRRLFEMWFEANGAACSE